MSAGSMPRRLKGLVVKESLQIVRDPSSILIAFVLPLILLFLYGYAVSLDATKLRIGLVLENPTPETRSLAAAFTGSKYFDATIGDDRRVFEEDLVAGRLRGIIVVPAWFQEREANPADTASIQVITDGSEPNTANFVENYSLGAWQGWNSMRLSEQGGGVASPISLASRVWFNEELLSRNYLVPGSIAIVLTLIGALLTSLVVAREWERGTMEALMATPVRIAEVILGKLVPYFFLGLGSMTLSTATAVTVFHVPLRGSILALWLVAAVFLLTALGMGLLISSAAKNQFVASQVALMTAYLPSFLLSGFIFEISSMPWPIRLVSRLIPARYFVQCLQTLFLAGDIWSVLLPNIGWMLLMAAVLFGITAKKIVKRLD